jgi:HD superfamily phosphohydrolase
MLFAPPVIAFVLLYVLNLAVICICGSSELQECMIERWATFSSANVKPKLFCRVNDHVDRAAALLVWAKHRVLTLGDEEADPKNIAPSLMKAVLVNKVEGLQAEIAALKEAQLLPLVTKQKSLWTVTRVAPSYPHTAQYLDDPIYGQVALDPALCRVFYHSLFQRLNYVRQLSFAYLVFPSASHSRLSHILGVMRNAEVALRRMLDKGWIYTSQGREPLDISTEERKRLLIKTQLCALLHDVGHGPFGHALDKLIPYLEPATSADVPDKAYSVKYVQELLVREVNDVALNAGFELDNVLNILDKERQMDVQGIDGLILDLIDSPLDVDRMDYLVRDAHMTGLGMGHSNVQALIEHMRPFRGPDGYFSLTFDESVLPHLEHLIYARDIMYINCYEHPRKVCAERLLARLAEFMLGRGLKQDDLMLFTDEQFLYALNLLTSKGTNEANFLRSLQENLDFDVVCEYRLSVWKKDKNKISFNDELSDEVKVWRDLRMGSNKQLKSVFIKTPGDWEERICREAKLPESQYWKVVVTVPAVDAKQEQESGTRILRSRGNGYETVELFSASTVMSAVATNLKPAREVIRVMVSADVSLYVRQEIKRAADGVFKRQPREI